MNHSPVPISRPAVAVLCDGENLSRRHASTVLAIAARYGEPRIRRTYGALEHIQPWGEEGFRLCPTRPGKNAADLLLCVEAMELALRDGFTTLMIASSDRDFSYLAEHLRETGVRVIGIGEAKAPKAFRAACSDFVTLDGVKAKNAAAGKAQTTHPAPAPKPPSAAPAPSELERLIPELERILKSSGVPGGWTASHWLRNQLAQSMPEAALGKLSHRDFSQAMIECGKFEVQQYSKAAVLLRPRQSGVSACATSSITP